MNKIFLKNFQNCWRLKIYQKNYEKFDYNIFINFPNNIHSNRKEFFKKIEEEIFIKEENLRIFKEKYELVFLEFTYLSRPSRLLAIMLNDKNEEYIHSETSNLKIFSEKQEKYLNKF